MSDNKKKILVIEDEETLIDLLVTKLKAAGYRVECATDGESGLKKIRSKRPDIILLDIVMPKKNGYEVMEAMRAENISIPVIIISNSGQPVEIEKTKKLGAVDYLIKTEFSPQEVLEKVSNYLGVKGRARESDKPAVPDSSINKDVQQLGIRVLLVEDDAFLREICSKKLINDGYEVYAAIDGQEALETVSQVKPDIVLLDIILPSIDGFQVLSAIRKHNDKKVAKTPVIMLSNLGQEEDIKKAMDMGANDYLVKAHFTTEEIADKIKQVIKKG
ncbi:response regulator [Candidatus Parcubacteria bacterium]|nr:response regulator [Candidatus Parcubacteria bacterium]